MGDGGSAWTQTRNLFVAFTADWQLCDSDELKGPAEATVFGSQEFCLFGFVCVCVCISFFPSLTFPPLQEIFQRIRMRMWT